MKLGIIARADDRGLGIQTWEAVRALEPERVLVIDMGDHGAGFPLHLDRYPGATLVRYDRGVLGPEDRLRGWLEGLDVVFSVETFYDWRVPAWADEAGAATVCQVNPEFMRPVDELPSRPTRWWAPTTWRLQHLPQGTRVVPVPVADDRFAFERPPSPGPLRVLHVAGHAAMADRNGTQIFLESMTRIRPPTTIRIVTQDRHVRGRPRGRIPVEVTAGGIADYWRLYDDADVLVMPRRYGGLCLPVQEAMAAGLAVVMSDTEPQRSTWPVVTVQTATGPPRLRCPAGRLPLANARPEALAGAINELADPERLATQQEASLEWARAHRWSVLRARYEEEFAEACAARA